MITLFCMNKICKKNEITNEACNSRQVNSNTIENQNKIFVCRKGIKIVNGKQKVEDVIVGEKVKFFNLIWIENWKTYLKLDL